MGPESLQLGLMLAESGVLESATNEMLHNPQLVLMTEKSPQVQRSVRGHVRKWRHKVRRKLSDSCHTESLDLELAIYHEVKALPENGFCQAAKAKIKQMEGKSEFYLIARRLLEKTSSHANPLLKQYFCTKWHESLSERIKEAQAKEVEVEKEAFLKALYSRIESFQQMAEVTHAGDWEKAGRLWDMASSKLTRHEIDTLAQTARFLDKHSELSDIAEKLGRMASEVDCPDLEKTPAEELRLVEEVSDNVTDDVVGIHHNNDLARLVASETLFLAEPELEAVFYQHFAEKQMLNYRMQGKDRTLRKVKAFRPEADKADIEKGPFVICIDASGSMSGFPEKCAKAMAYRLMQIALNESRECYVMIFSTSHISYELTGENGIKEALDFLSYSFHGGTDFTLAIEESISVMESAKFRNADLVVISDFIAPHQPDEVLEKVEKLKRDHTRFHAVCLSQYGNPSLLSMFDHCWEYHPTTLGRLVKKGQENIFGKLWGRKTEVSS